MPLSIWATAPGLRIKTRLESAVVCLEIGTSWEDLHIYLCSDEEFPWDHRIFLQHRSAIVAAFLTQCAKAGLTPEEIACCADTLEEGQQAGLFDDSKVTEAADISTRSDRTSDDDTIRQLSHDEPAKSKRTIFHVSWDDNNHDGLIAKDTKNLMSRIRETIVINRWGLKDKMYNTLTEENRMVPAINLKWELDNKTYVTVFLVVQDALIAQDVELGMNKFEGIGPKDPPKANSTTAESAPSTTSLRKDRAQSEKAPRTKSVSGQSTRRPGSGSSVGGTLPPKHQFVLESVAHIAEQLWEKENAVRDAESEYEDAVEDDSRSYRSSRPPHSTPNTSISDSAGNKKNGKRREHRGS